MIAVISILIVVWFTIGTVWVKMREEGWLIMMTNPMNTNRTWMALPSLFLCWTLWPFCNWVARNMFLLSRI